MSKENIAATPEITDLSHVKFEVFRLEQEEKNLGFIVTSHRIQAARMQKKNKLGLAALHSDYGQKLLDELKTVRSELARMKNQLDDMTGE